MLRDYWYAACPSRRLRSRPLAATVLDAELVVFRDGNGAAHAMIDRCSHRGARLSCGRVVGDHIECPYHGWRYDGGGSCKLIPSLRSGASLPPGITVPTLPCAEQDGYVWVWMPGSSPEPNMPVPTIAGFASRRWLHGSVNMACSARAGIENNLDWCHPAFAHPWTHPQYYRRRFRGFTQHEYEVQVTANGLKVFAPPAPPDTDAADPVVTLEFELPNRVRVSFSRPIELVNAFQFVPTGANTCRLEWMRTKVIPAGRRLRWSSREPVVLRQDRVLLEGSQPWYDQDPTFERSVKADTATQLARRILDLAAAGQWPAKQCSLPAASVVAVRA